VQSLIYDHGGHINGSAKRASELLLGLLRLLLALDRKLIPCGQGASFGYASTRGSITYSVPRAASRYYLESTKLLSPCQIPTRSGSSGVSLISILVLA